MPEQQNTNGCTEESCAGCAHADSCSSKKEDFREPENKYSSIKKVIGVVSGKGGVGKSLVTASLARMMREKGYTVGILDADITGLFRKCTEYMRKQEERKKGFFHVLQKMRQELCRSIFSWKTNPRPLFGEVRLLREL